MRVRVFLIAGIAISLAACGGGTGTTVPPAHSQNTADKQASALARAVSLLPAKFHVRSDARLYKSTAIGIVDGNRSATFIGSSTVTHTPAGITVVDAATGQTFHFSANATVQSLPGAAIIAIPRNGTLPSWAARSGAVPQ